MPVLAHTCRNLQEQGPPMAANNQETNTASAKPKLTFCENETGLFDEKQERREQEIHRRVAHHRRKLANAEHPIALYKRAIQEIKNEIMAEWPVLFGETPSKIFIHMDLDCFFAAVEILDHPELKDVPIGIGSKEMIGTCNYPARKYGIHAGMPGYKALQLFPGLVLIKPRFEKYMRASKNVMKVLRRFYEELEVQSIDEACMIIDRQIIEEGWKKIQQELKRIEDGQIRDELKERCSGLVELKKSRLKFIQYGDKTSLSYENIELFVAFIREITYYETGLRISAGVSVCRGLAKFSSNINKPNGQFIVLGNFDSHLLNLKVEKINGIGNRTKEVLNRSLGIETVGDLREKALECAKLFGTKTMKALIRCSYGLSYYDVSNKPNIPRERLSCSISRTILNPSCADVLHLLLAFSERLERYLKQSGKHATILTVTIKYRTFDNLTKQKKINKPFRTKCEIFDYSISLFDSVFSRGTRTRWEFEDSLRLVGLAVSGLVEMKKQNKLRFKKSKESKECQSLECPLCQHIFLNYTQQAYEHHVNCCIDINERKQIQAKTKQGILKFITKRKE